MTTSKRRFSKRANKPSPEDIIGIQDILLEYILTHRWTDYDQFARNLSLKLLQVQPPTGRQLIELVESTVHPFFRRNHLNKTEFTRGLPVDALIARANEAHVFTKQSVMARIRKRHPLGKKLRLLILQRDQFRCTLCGKNARETVLEVDHILPVAKGGTDTLDNLRTLCFDCNRGKSDLNLGFTPK